MQSVRTSFFIVAFLCLSQQVAFAEDAVDTNAAHHHPVEEVDTNISTTEEEFDPSLSQPEYNTTEQEDSSSTAKDILSELIIRPVAVVASATGLVMFIVASPFSGLASIPAPHDAFKTTWEDFVVTPYRFAFRRPFGDFSTELN